MDQLIFVGCRGFEEGVISESHFISYDCCIYICQTFIYFFITKIANLVYQYLLSDGLGEQSFLR